jgi:hypothetical protein
MLVKFPLLTEIHSVVSHKNVTKVAILLLAVGSLLLADPETSSYKSVTMVTKDQGPVTRSQQPVARSPK